MAKRRLAIRYSPLAIRHFVALPVVANSIRDRLDLWIASLRSQ
ncbi:MAG: hypothetical protein ABSC22_15395 [Roseiarcus sp.]|jgi:hypothetical protein